MKKDKKKEPMVVKEEEMQEYSMVNSESDKSSRVKGRQDNSLAVLTRKFVKLIKQKSEQTIDLNEAVNTLKVQKRRIYDITNVLEGIGYVEKLHKNTIHWMGESDDLENEREIKQYMMKLKSLQEEEEVLDMEVDNLNKNIKEQYLENQRLKDQHYITYQDCLEIAKSITKQASDKALIVLSAPKGSVLEAVEQGDGTSQLIMNSHNKGQIMVYIADPHNNTVQKFQG